MSSEKPPYKPDQLSFLPPEDVQMLARLRFIVAEAERLYYPSATGTKPEAPRIQTPEDIYRYFRGQMAELPQEQMRVANLSTRHDILSSHMIYQGTLNASAVRACEIFRPAVIDNAAAIVVAHNHPSGDPEPSREDVRFTQGLVKAGKILDIQVLDHVVIAKLGFVSLAERGLMNEYRS
jgi:DNA repair protein RadC